MSVSLVLSALCSLFFMLAMHFVFAIVAPAVVPHTFPVIVVSIVSVTLAVASSLPYENRRFVFGIVSMCVMLYFVVALTISFSSSYPGLYTAPYALFGVFSTSKMFLSFSAISRLLTGIPQWREFPDLYPPELTARLQLEFDRHVRLVTTAVILMASTFAFGMVLAVTSVEEVSGPFLMFGVPLLFMASVLVVYTRIVVRMKRLYVEGFNVEEKHIIQPMLFAFVVCIGAVVISGLLASDTSIFHYSIFISFVERVFGIERSPDSSGVGVPLSSGPSGGGYSSPPSSIGRGGGVLAFGYMFRYVVLIGAIVATIAYLIITLIRMRDSARHQRGTFWQRIRHGRSRLRYAIVRAIRLWRTLLEHLRSALRLRIKIGNLVTTRADGPAKIGDSAENAAKRAERNTVLRWYAKLVEWGEQREIEHPRGATADEYLQMVSSRYPQQASAAMFIAETFDAAFYSRTGLKRRRLREYVRKARAILGEKSGG